MQRRLILRLFGVQVSSAVLALLVATPAVFAQNSDAAVGMDEAAKSQPSAPAPAQAPAATEAPATPASTTASLPTVADLTAQRQALAQDTELDDPTRADLDQQYQKAIDNLQAAEQADRKSALLAQQLEQAPQKIAELQERLSNPPPADATAGADEITGIEALSAKVQEVEALAATRRQDFQETKAEIERRNAKRPQLPELRAQIEKQLQQTAQDLTAPPPADENPRVTAVRPQRLQTKQHRLRREQALLEQEARTYEGAARYLSLKQDVAERDVREAERAVQQWQKKLAEAQRRQAEADARRARDEIARSHKEIENEAKRNAELADENTRLVNALQDSQQTLNEFNAELEEREQRFKELKERADKAKFSPAIGVLLRKRQAELPDLDQVRLSNDGRQSEYVGMSLEERQSEIDALYLAMLDWESEKKPLLDLNEATAEVIDELDSIPASITKEDLERQVQSLLQTRLKLLDSLLATAQAHLDKLVSINTSHEEYVAEVEEEAHWLAEHVLWVRSTGIIGTQPQVFWTSMAELRDERAWRNAGAVLLLDLSANWGWWLVGAAGVLAMAIVRRRSKRKIKDLGEVAERASCIEILPTVQTVLLSLLVATPGPLLVFLLGLRIAEISHGEDLLSALGVGLQYLAGSWGVISLIRQIAQSHGLADAHFNWPRPALAAMRRTTRFLSVSILPFVFLVAFSEELRDPETVATFGRLAYLGGLGCFAWAMYRLLRPSSPMILALKSSASASLLYRSRSLWISLFLALPLVLAIASAAGYHYTAFQLTGRAALTLGCAVSILLITAFLHRWLLLTYRRLAIQRSRERRQQLLQAAQNDPDQTVPAEVTPELTLVDINEQARSMLRLAAGACSVIAVYLIWVDVLPALGFLRNFELWRIDDPSGETEFLWITAADVLNAILVGALTVLASRNLPGMMEIAVLQRLPMDAGARYAATTVSRYLIVVTGMVLGFQMIGISWASVQWLVAAMTVGLGFGLQEIFANFVSGIILLFERPMRVGDMVTIGGSSGTVTRIQIRATTILDWDYKELIVPNREFVTGNLINWTLSSPTLRIVIKVGIAYGSDTRLATELLMRAAKENPLVLEDPPPFPIFTSFGASSLDYELRLYVSGLKNYGRTQHEMHTAIDDLFREHNIEISFPQRDLHVRSLPEDLIQQLTRAAATANPRDRSEHAFDAA